MNRDELLEKSKMLSNARDAQIFDKQKMRAELQSKLNEYLAAGGKIIEMVTPESVPRPPAKYIKQEVIPQKQRRAYYDYEQNSKLRLWCAEAKGRAKRLSVLIGYSETWVSMRCRGEIFLALTDWHEIKPAMGRVEQAERDAHLSAIAKKYSGVAQ